MAVTPANQTFRAGILPVLLNVPVNFDVVDTDLDTAALESTGAAFLNFNNEKLRFTGMDAVKTKSGLAGVDCTLAVGALDTEIVSGSTLTSVATNFGNLDLLGFKIVAGLPVTTVGVNNNCIPQAFKNFGLVLALKNNTGAPVTDVNASCFVNMQFVPEKSVVKITA